MSQGLPCVAHDYEITRFILGPEGYLADLKEEGSLASLVSKILAEGNSIQKLRLRHQSCYERFSWDQILPQYVEMIQRTVISQ